VLNNQIHRKQKGFTLLEMVIAMAIFAVVMVIVMGGINLVLKSQEQVSTRAKRLAEVQMAVAVLARDLTQIVNRPVRDANGDLTAILKIDPNSTIRLELTSGGNVNPNAQYQRSTLQRVGYGLENEALIRTTWPVLDRAINTPQLRRHLLSHVAALKVEYLNAKGEYINNAAEAIALYIDIDLGKEGHYRRTFSLYNEAINAPKS
jgi:general secretion pathway protein J